jgi:homoserine dehydrogenase
MPGVRNRDLRDIQTFEVLETSKVLCGGNKELFVRQVRVALIGLGNVGKAFLQLMTGKEAVLREQYGLSLVLTAAADSSGGLVDGTGIDPAGLLAHKLNGRGVASYPGGEPGLSAPGVVARAPADLLLEASPVNLETGQPGLDTVRSAIGRGIGVVLANKGPLVHAFAELTAAARSAGAGFAYSATVCGALPVVNLGQRDLVGCDIRSVRGVFNSTSNSILEAMSLGGSYSQALRQAQLDGIAEADPALDVDGWDTANKLVIVANCILGMPATLRDVRPVTGIGHITPEQILEGLNQGKSVKLVATAERTGGGYRLSVEPQWLPRESFLASVSGWEMGILFDTDIMGLQQFKVDERGPTPTAAAMLRDVINLSR